MIVLKMQMAKQHEVFLRYVFNNLRSQRYLPSVTFYTTTVSVIDAFDNDFLQRQREKMTNKHFIVPDISIQHFVKPDTKTIDVSALNEGELDKTLQQLVLKNRDKQIEQIVTDCLHVHKLISDMTLKTLLKHYGNTGKPDMINVLQKYCSKTLPNMYSRNGEFNHYLAEAQCFKGNSEKGLSILKDCYMKNKNLQCVYIVIFKRLIHDSVLNRSEASLVVFKKYVLEFSSVWEEHYPLVCLWHICWLSSWYSDQMLSDELWNDSEHLREIVGEKVTALSISALKANYNEDAVVRLLQTLLKYEMIDEYSKVLQVLFNYKLINRDIRGCSEILRNCEVLGITLPSDQQGRYIKMLICGTRVLKQQQIKSPSKDFKLKF